MSYDPEIHHRRSIRLKEYDYSQDGFYFITICVHGRIPLFGNIVDDMMQLNDAGRMVEKEYLQLPDKYPHVVCHEYVVMPNHFHCIIGISDMDNPVGASLVGARQMPDYMYAGTHKGCPYGEISLYFLAYLTKNHYLYRKFTTMDEFTFRTYGKGELAQLYNPSITSRAACKKLQRWIERNTELHAALQRSGLTPHSKEYTPYQVRLIVDALGEP